MTELVRTIYKSCTRIHNTLQFQVIFTINMAVNKAAVLPQKDKYFHTET